MKRALDLFSIIILNLAIIWFVMIASVGVISSSPRIYREVLREAGVYSTVTESGKTRYRIIDYIGGDVNKSALLTDGQLDLIVEHITDYLYTDMESFDLKLDGVYNLESEKYEDGVSIFGEQAIRHMEFVRELLHAALISLIPVGILMLALIIIMIKRADPKQALKYTGITYALIAAFAAVFCAWAYISRGRGESFFYSLWGKMHYLMFPFSDEAFLSSFLLDALVCILTTEFFLIIVLTVGAILLSSVFAWVAFLVLRVKFSKKQAK